MDDRGVEEEEEEEEEEEGELEGQEEEEDVEFKEQLAEASGATQVMEPSGKVSASETQPLATYPPVSVVTSTDELDFLRMLFSPLSRCSASICCGSVGPVLVLRDNCDIDPLDVGIGDDDVPVGCGSDISSAPRGCRDNWRLTRSARPVLCRLKPDMLTLALRI